MLDERRPISHEFEGQTAADPGVMHYWHVTYTPVILDGRLVGVGAAVQDISERKRAEGRAAFLSRAGEMLDSLDYRSCGCSRVRLAASFAQASIATWPGWLATRSSQSSIRG